jgi:transposase
VALLYLKKVIIDMDTPITKIRETIRLLISHPDISSRQAEKIIKISRTTVGKIKELQAKSNINIDEIVNLSDDKLNKRLGLSKSESKSNKPCPDLEYIEKELTRPNLTLMLLWHEFKESNPDGISYVHFARLFKAWRKKKRVSMKQTHLAGDKLFVDFCGQTVPIFNENQSINFSAKIFVGVMGASQFTVIYAVASEKKKDWLLCHVKAFEQLGGVPNFVVPDNLKSGVTKHTRDHVEVNHSYAALGEYYNCFILPARPLKPQDKSLAELGVKIVQNQILAKYRNYKFYSLAELNQKLLIEIEALNAKHSKTFNTSRIQRFIDIDADELKTLPVEPYPLDDWIYETIVDVLHHFKIDSNSYSVPFQYIGQYVDIQISINTISFYHGRELIASHKKSDKTGVNVTIQTHLTSAHQYQAELEPDRLLAWGKKIGVNTFEVVRRNLKERRDISNGFICVKFLKKWLSENDDKKLLEEACKYSIKIHSVTQQTLISVLKNKPFLSTLNQEKDTAKTVKKTHENIRGSDYYSGVNNDDN